MKTNQPMQNYKNLQKMASKRPKYKKITEALKEKLRLAYVQGVQDPQGFRVTATIEELAKENKLSQNTLYKLAQREQWKEQQEQFQAKYLEQLDKVRVKEFVEENKKFDNASLQIAKALLAKVGTTIKTQQNANIEDFSPQQLDQLASAGLKIQKFAKMALGETTDRIDINATTSEQGIFQEAMELIDQVVRERQQNGDGSVH